MTDTKTCAHCDREFGPAAGSSPHKWALRRFCSPPCASRWAAAMGQRADRQPEQAKTCPVCSRQFRRGVLSASHWAQRIFCGKSCASRRVPNRGPEVKPCEHCGEKFKRSKWDDNGKWQERRFCSVRCANAVTRGTRQAARPTPCVICGKPASSRGAKTCSRKCSNENRRQQGLLQALRAPQPTHIAVRHGPERPPDEGAPLAIINYPRPEAIRSILQECDVAYRVRWLESLAPPVRAHALRMIVHMKQVERMRAEHIMAGLR